MRTRYFVTTRQIYDAIVRTRTKLRQWEVELGQDGSVEAEWNANKELRLTLPNAKVVSFRATWNHELVSPVGAFDCDGHLVFLPDTASPDSARLMQTARKVKEYAYMVVGLYDDTNQRFADTYYAVSEMAAERDAANDHPTLRVAAVFRVYEKDDDNIKQHGVASSAQLLSGHSDIYCMELKA
jgi:hypothetical protein